MNIANYYLNHDDETQDTWKPRASSVSKLGDLSAHTYDILHGMPKRMDSIVAMSREDCPEHYQYFKSVQRMFQVETHVDLTASSKLMVTPKIAGFGLSLYYEYNKNIDLYQFKSARLNDPSAIANLTEEQLDVTQNVYMVTIDRHLNPEYRLVPIAIKPKILEEYGVSLASDDSKRPKFIAIRVVMTVPYMQVLDSGVSLDEILRTWLSDPNDAMKKAYPKPDFVAYNLVATSGYFSKKHNRLRGSLRDNRRYFQLSRRTVIAALNSNGFKTIVSHVDSDNTCLRGRLLGVNTACHELYILPALYSIKETNLRIKSAHKKKKSLEELKRVTASRDFAKDNLLNYLRYMPYYVEGLIVEPNYHTCKRDLEDRNVETEIFLTEKDIERLPNMHILDLMKTLKVGVADAESIADILGYDGTSNPINKTNIKRVVKEGYNLDIDLVADYRADLDTIITLRDKMDTHTLIVGREKIWDITV